MLNLVVQPLNEWKTDFIAKLYHIGQEGLFHMIDVRLSYFNCKHMSFKINLFSKLLLINR
jgi:hypothetical protein